MIQSCKAVLVLFFVFTITGCLNNSESDFDREVRDADEAIESYLSTNNIDTDRLTSGVHLELLESNEDGRQIANEHVVGIVYEMSLLESDHVIESHTDDANPVRFNNSYNFNFNALLPAGLNVEIDRLREGERARFYIPSYQAYGSYAHNDLFDEYSNFIIDLTVVEVNTEEEIYELESERISIHVEENEPDAESYPNSLYHRILEEGDGDMPGSSNVVEFHFTRTYLDGTLIETTEDGDPMQVLLSGNQLVRGLEEGIGLMKEGETARLIMPSRLAFGMSLQILPQSMRRDFEESNDIQPLVRPYKPVIYEVKLLSVD
jgi:FKBP-type peptidyl-prolyl cis-trans isomerase FkpA